MPQACARVLGNQTCGSGRVVGYLEVENDFRECCVISDNWCRAHALPRNWMILRRSRFDGLPSGAGMKFIIDLRCSVSFWRNSRLASVSRYSVCVPDSSQPGDRRSRRVAIVPSTFRRRLFGILRRHIPNAGRRVSRGCARLRMLCRVFSFASPSLNPAGFRSPGAGLSLSAKESSLLDFQIPTPPAAGQRSRHLDFPNGR